MSNKMNALKVEQQEWPLGTHLVTPRFGYRHHGIYIGNGEVLHYAGLSEWWHIGPVEKISLDHFSSRHAVWVKEHPKAKYKGAAVVARAYSRLGERNYSLFNNNCEHLCTWSIDDVSHSEQVAELLLRPTLLLTTLSGLISKATEKMQRKTEKLAASRGSRSAEISST
jgi:hypothetical protein